MDGFTGSVFLISFVVCLALVYVFSVLGTKEQTYEDALRLSREKGVDTHSAREKKDKKAKWSKKPEKSKEPVKSDLDSKGKQESKLKISKVPDQPEISNDAREEQTMRKRKKKSKPAKVYDEEEAKALNVQEDVVEVSQSKNEEKQSTSSTPEPVKEDEVVIDERPVVNEAVKAKKNQRKKMVVEDVDMTSGDKSNVPVNEPNIVKEDAIPLYDNDQLKETEHPSPSQEKSKGKKRIGSTQKVPEPSKKPQLQAHDLLSAVKKTTFEEEELQNLIDILLNKQHGSPGSMNGGWEERSGQANEIKQLEKSLQDTRNALMEETSKVKSLTERWNQVRQEMNMAKAQQAQAQRIAEGHQQELQKYQQRIQQEESRRINEINNLQNQITYKHQQCQQLQATVEQLSLASQNFQQPSPDLETVRAELDQSKQAYGNLDQEVNNLRNKIGLKESEAVKLQKELGQVQTRFSEELSKAKEEAKRLEIRCSALEKESKDSSKRRKSESEKVDELLTKKKKLEGELKDAKDSLKSYEQKNSLLREDNDRLSKKLSASGKLPAKDSCNGNISPETNGSAVNESIMKKLKSENEALFKQVQEAKKEVQAIANEKIVLQKEAKGCKEQVEVVTRDLNELRDRNDAANAKKAREEIEKSQRNLLSRLFPELEIKDHKDFSSWMDDFSSKVSSLKSKLPKGSPGDDSVVEDLKKQVNHYKKVLNDTESILHRLQSSVETEEFQWKQKMSEKQSEVESLKLELSGSNNAMQTSLDVVQSAEEETVGFELGGLVSSSYSQRIVSASVDNGSESIQPWSLGLQESEPSSIAGVKFACGTLERAMPLIFDEMEEKLKELQNKLLSEEENKEVQSAENKRLAQKIDELTKTLESEQKVKTDLGEQVARMNQLVATGQEALQQEQKTVGLLRDQVASLKAQIPSENFSGNEADGNPPSLTDGEAKKRTQSITSSQIGSIGSLDQSENSTPTKDKKSKKKKLLGLLDISKKKKSTVSGNDIS